MASERPTEERLILRSVSVENSTVFSSSDWDKIIKPYLNREVDFPTLLELQRQLTALYRNAGYPTSRFVLLDQDINNATVTYQAIEGKLVKITIEGLSHLQDSYIRSRLEAAASSPLSMTKLQEALVLLQQNPLIETIEADFEAGVIQGESTLLVRIVEAPQILLGIKADNWENPQIGAVGMSVYGSNLNVWGWGERLDFEYKLTEDRGLARLFASYTVPLNVDDTTLRLYYRDDDTRIVETPLEDVGLVTESSTFSVGVTQPLIKKPNEELNIDVSLDIRQSENFIFETIPFPTFGDSNRLNLSVLRLSASFLSRTPETSFGISSQLSLGLGVLGASPESDLLNTDFFSWQLQAQYAIKLSDNWIFLSRFQGQVTPDSLPSMEQFALGGGRNRSGVSAQYSFWR
ncbi:ShlB/FhaC/HecB family hemolysin secretion/activation protein [Crocosphaera sp. XPORK-15E]|uniref:ShlB/FhaC/HecB family hemolysin secretion/activation protein n=1 Tax=Crocosphaera sp. XPORK-15E TaxID=3110247 RepID=UPI002B1FC9E0|nr:ShlB/FhaC/HecB family hemolysin secretion/activation protein [Crocosphaera sp. XPORK-15E]MEA5537356.1 ShlB/FhaC/HecB family hemolysin secretion/activation protein [Crocosphaera sp. XPORK-15E]